MDVSFKDNVFACQQLKGLLSISNHTIDIHMSDWYLVFLLRLIITFISRQETIDDLILIKFKSLYKGKRVLLNQNTIR